MPEEGWYSRMGVTSNVSVSILHEVTPEIEEYMLNCKNPTLKGCSKIFNKFFKKGFNEAMYYKKQLMRVE